MKSLVILAFTFCFISNLFSQKQKADTSYGSVQLFAGGGISINSVSITGSSSGLEINIDHPKSYAPAFVVGSKFTLAKSKNSLVILTTIRIYSINSTAEKELQSGLATYHHTSTFKAQPIISPTASLGYNIIRNRNFKWYVSGGIGFAFLFNGEEVQSNYYFPSDTTIKADRKPNPMIFAFNVQTGFDIGKHLGAWMFYHPPTNTSTKVEKKVQISSLQLGLSYYFKVK
ncbi:MAG: hypothetical protein ACJ749_05130 [Flavisolibacter sp.]